jgi:DNA-binding phage protein
MEQQLALEARYQALCGRLDEAALRLWAATEARSLGRGGVSLVAKATGLSRTTIHAGLSELNAPVSAGEQGVQLVSFKLVLLASLMNFTRRALSISLQ